MKKAKLFGMILCAAVLTGCGGEYAGLPEGDIVSGSAVSGEAVSGEAIRERVVSGDAIREKAVSGPAVADGKEKSRNGEKQDMSSHRFCTDTNLYYVEDGHKLMQARVDGTHRKCIKEWQKKEVLSEVIYADKNWLYYQVDSGEENTLYRVPIEKDVKGQDVIGFQKAEEFIKEKKPTVSLYMDSDYYFYADMTNIIKYDIKRKKVVSHTGLFDGLFCGEVFRGKGHYFNVVDDGKLYIQKIDSAQWEKVSDGIDYLKNDIFPVSNDEELFYFRYTTRTRFDIQRHDGEQEREFVTWDQLIQAVEKVTGTKKMDVCMPDELFWQEGRLYIQLQTGWMDGGTYHMEYMMFSQGMDGSRFRYEKSLTECMKSHVRERNGKWAEDGEETVYVKHMAANKARCIAMIDGKAYLNLYDYGKDKGRLGCYDLKSEKFEWIRKTDKAFYKLGFDQELSDFETIFNETTDNQFAEEWYWPPSNDTEDHGYFMD